MPRRRVAVALLPPPDLADAVDALRRLLGDTRLARLPPHLTLVPPVNLDPEDLVGARAVLREAAVASTDLELLLGPTESFAPRTPTLHLAVGGDVAELAALRGRLRRAPLDRPDEHDFHPHVTLRQSLPEALLAGALEVLTGTLGSWTVDRVHLLEHVQDEAGPRWVVGTEEPFGRPQVVGRGGIELRLRVLRTVEPVLVGLVPGLHADERPPAGRLVVVAEAASTPGVPVGAAVGTVEGSTAALRRLQVAPDERRQGIGRHVVARFCTEAARLGATLVVADPDPAGDDGDESAVGSAALASYGFAAGAGLWLRRCGASAPN